MSAGTGWPRGEAHHLAKLSNAEVDQVHALRGSGLSLAQIASKLFVSKSCIAHICSGRRRAPVEDPALVLQNALRCWR